jgi:hypothetical protein
MRSQGCQRRVSAAFVNLERGGQRVGPSDPSAGTAAAALRQRERPTGRPRQANRSHLLLRHLHRAPFDDLVFDRVAGLEVLFDDISDFDLIGLPVVSLDLDNGCLDGNHCSGWLRLGGLSQSQRRREEYDGQCGRYDPKLVPPILNNAAFAQIRDLLLRVA